MKKLIGKLMILLVLFIPTSIFADVLNKEAGYVYLASFNVYKLGAVDAKYQSIDNWEKEAVDDSIPERIANLGFLAVPCG